MTGLFHVLDSVNIIWGIGQLESQLSLSPIQAIIDDEIAGLILRGQRGIRADEEALALNWIKKVGLAGDFISTEHTMAHYREELYYPNLVTRCRRGAWQEQGARSLGEKAHDRLRDILAEDRDPLLSPEQANEIARIEQRWLEYKATER